MLIQLSLKGKLKKIYINLSYLMSLRDRDFLFKKILNLKIKKQFTVILIREINNILL